VILRLVVATVWALALNVISNFVYDLWREQLMSLFSAQQTIKQTQEPAQGTELVRAMRREAVAQLGEGQGLQQYRIVAKGQVWARSGRSHRSVRLRALRAGDVVCVVEKKKEWVRIGWYDPDNRAIATGWVQSKRLRSIDR
jgi:hypothetical protein